jgi:hypothetical protein
MSSIELLQRVESLLNSLIEEKQLHKQKCLAYKATHPDKYKEYTRKAYLKRKDDPVYRKQRSDAQRRYAAKKKQEKKTSIELPPPLSENNG